MQMLSYQMRALSYQMQALRKERLVLRKETEACCILPICENLRLKRQLYGEILAHVGKRL